MRTESISVFGSSPRLRGTLQRGGQRGAYRRFIPAPAGNTQDMIVTMHLPPVHPRACGEHTFHGNAKTDDTGSSPRLRGTQ